MWGYGRRWVIPRKRRIPITRFFIKRLTPLGIQLWTSRNTAATNISVQTWLHTQARRDGCTSMKSLMTFFTAGSNNTWVRVILLTLYYFAIIAGLIMMYGKGNFTPPDFVYQGF